MNIRHCLGTLSRAVPVPLGLALPIALMTISAPLAADIPARPIAKGPIAAPIASWTGCYVDAGGGYGMWNQESNYQTDPTFGPVTVLGPTTTSGGRGWFGTLGGGCDYQIGDRWLIGAFADYDFSDFKGNYLNPTIVRRGDETLRSSWAAGGRIGWMVTPTILTYFNGGYSQARFSRVGLVQAFIPPIPTPFHLPATTYSGWFLGGGTEIMFAPSWFIRSEYRYARYDNEFVTILEDATSARSGFGTSSEKFVQTIRTELVWRWGWGR
jgi:outer membrane immunogenic protein